MKSLTTVSVMKIERRRTPKISRGQEYFCA